MEGLMNRIPTETSSSINLDNNIQYTTEPSTYDCEAACRLVNFDTTPVALTNHLINSLAVADEAQVQSFDLLEDINECPLEIFQEVVKGTLERYKDRWKNFELVEEFFQNSWQTLLWLPELEKYLNHARDRRLLILAALQLFEEESDVGGSNYVKTLELLNDFKVSDNPFTEEFSIPVYGQLRLTSGELQIRDSEIQKQIKYIKFFKKVSIGLFAAIFVFGTIWSVAAFVMAETKVTVEVSASTLIPIGGGMSINSLLKKYKKALKGREEVISSMQVGTYAATRYLEKIRSLIKKVKIDIEKVMQNVDLAIEKEAVKSAIEEIKKKPEEFEKKVKDLGEQANKCNSDIRKAVIEVLRRIIKPSN